MIKSLQIAKTSRQLIFLPLALVLSITTLMSVLDNLNSQTAGALSSAVQAGVSDDKTELYNTWESAAYKLNEELAILMPDDFSGIWIGKDDYRIKVGIVSEDKIDHVMKLAASLGVSEVTDIIQMKYSSRELSTIYDELLNIAREKYNDKLPTYSVSLAPSENKVTVKTYPEMSGSEASDSIRSELASKYGEVVNFKTGRVVQAIDDCSGSHCAMPLRGGVWIAPYGGLPCTSGFIVEGYATGNRYVLTAGHCADGYTGSTWRAKEYSPASGSFTERFIGSVTQNKLSERTDAMIIKRTTSSEMWTTKGWIYMRDGDGEGAPGPSRNSQWEINGYMSNSGLEGARVCGSGGVSGSSCGRIQDVNLSNVPLEDGSTTWYADGIVRTSMCATNGDSGGPVVKGDGAGLALGILTGVDVTGCSYGVYYTGMTSIMNKFDNSFFLVPA